MTMVDILRMIKNVMDAHGAWVFGGAVAAGLVAHQARKRRSFDADWFQVTCYGCGRSGFSDEFAGVTTPDGRQAYQCVRCQRPDLFKQAEGVDYSTIVYRVRVRDVDGEGSGENYHYRTVDSAMEHVNNVIAAYDWYGFREVPVAGERRKWKTSSGEDWEIMMTPIRLGNIVREAEYDYDEYGFITGPSAERLVAKILRDDPYDYEVGDHLLIIDGKIVEVGGNSQMEHFEKEDFWDNVDEHMIVVIKSVDPYTFDWELHQDEPVFHGAEATNACPHCEGAAGFPREFYYQSDRIEMVPCGTCLTQGRCPGCMEIYPGLTRDNTPEDVFFGSGCDRCGYSESDAREARKTARRWADLVDNPAAAKFMAEGGDTLYMVQHESRDGYDPYFDGATVYADPHEAIKHWEALMLATGNDPKSYEEDEFDPNWRFHDGGDRIILVSAVPVKDDFAIMGFQDFEMLDDHGFLEQPPWSDLYYTIDEDLDVSVGMEAEDYGVGAVWMADTYDSSKHGNLLPMGSVKRFLASMPISQKFHVDFVKSNGEIRSMDAVLTKPYDPDSRTADVLEITDTGGKAFKRFRVDRVFVLYRV